MICTVYGYDNFVSKNGKTCYRVHLGCLDPYGKTVGNIVMTKFVNKESFDNLKEVNVNYDIQCDFNGRIVYIKKIGKE